MNYSEIKTFDIANGTGVRTTLFVSGCTHRCEGCFNQDTWDFNYGNPFTEETIEKIINSCSSKHVAGLTLLGGEPFEPENQRALIHLLRRFHKELPEKNVWAYSGYTYESDLLAEDGRAHCEVTTEMLSLVDVLVDGEFILAQKDISLKFRGSRNQRIIELNKQDTSTEVRLCS